ASHPDPSAFRVGATGLPVVSAAGLVQVAVDGPEVYDAFHLPELLEWAKSSGRLDSVDWCEVESLCAVQRGAHEWRRRHPDAARVGIGEVTGSLGGFPDFAGKGVSEHLTHQVGINVNVMYMSRARPEQPIKFGEAHQDAYDLGLERELLGLLFDAGASAMTMT